MGLLTAMLAIAGLPAGAQNIITVTGPGTTNPPSGATYASWTQTGSFSNVTIQATLYSCFGDSAGTAYLTQNGRAVGNQVAINSSLVVHGGNNGAASTVTVFSGLNLGPGTYYLTINPTPGNECSSLWDNTTAPSTSLGTGVTNNGAGVSFGGIAAYPPASTFKGSWFFLYSASGSSASTPVPALSPGAMFATMFLLLSSGLFLMRKYRPQE